MPYKFLFTIPIKTEPQIEELLTQDEAKEVARNMLVEGLNPEFSIDGTFGEEYKSIADCLSMLSSSERHSKLFLLSTKFVIWREPKNKKTVTK